ncbi:hypothetical protein [Xanthovirga aplysinae]|uniref:hypothetical protein n=1 Tax=Xanthovirga aplysinae TaxID=2529853 RepID=UPI0012BB729F|nr:hypothetical protein [Xanthovirga aplysinae]MTI33128.1 hypothetical protein [Xanthovirga aplysinae]
MTTKELLTNQWGKPGFLVFIKLQNEHQLIAHHNDLGNDFDEFSEFDDDFDDEFNPKEFKQIEREIDRVFEEYQEEEDSGEDIDDFHIDFLLVSTQNDSGGL